MPFLEEDMCFGKRKKDLGEGSVSFLVWNHAARGCRSGRGTKEQRNKQI